MKVCKVCNIEKPLSEFGKRLTMKDGYKSECKKCLNIQSTKDQRSKKGLFSRIYGHQLESSRKRGHPQPLYNLDELRNKYIDTELFNSLYIEWVNSGYDKKKTPSFDRLDNTKGYSFENIQLVTWGKNNKLGSIYLRENPNSGALNGGNKSVLQFTIDGDFIAEYISLSMASRINNISHQRISSACSGKHNTTGFIWKYKNDNQI